MSEITVALSDKVDTTQIVHERIFDAIAETIALAQGGLTSLTSLLMHMDGVDGSVIFPDSSLTPQGNAFVVGTAQVDTDTVDAFGTNAGILLLDGSSYIYFNPNVAFQLGFVNFVAEGRVQSTDTINNQVIYGQHGAAFQNVGVVLNVVANRLHMYIGGNAGAYNIDYTAPTGDVCDGNWNHCAIVRTGNEFRLMLNGVQVGATQTYAGSVTSISDTAKVCIGVLRHASPTFFFNGVIDEVRLTKGSDLGWSGGFTPSTVPYFNYATDRPSPAAIWTSAPLETVVDMSTFRAPENNNTGDAGTVEYQYAFNNSALNGSWLTQAQMQDLGTLTITNATNSIKFIARYISDSTQKTTTRAFATVEAEVPSSPDRSFQLPLEVIDISTEREVIEL